MGFILKTKSKTLVLLLQEAPYSLKYKRQVLRAVGVADCVLIFINVVCNFNFCDFKIKHIYRKDKQFGITSVAKQFRKELGTLCVSLR